MQKRKFWYWLFFQQQWQSTCAVDTYFNESAQLYFIVAFTGYLGIKFHGYLISRLEKNYISRVFNFAIWWLQKISQVFNFAISVKIRNESLFSIVNQYNCYQICCKNSNLVIISRDICDLWVAILWSNIRKYKISNSTGI